MKLKKTNSFILMLFILFVFAFSACNTNKKNDNLVWTNDNAVYAYVKEGYENGILKNVEGAFESLHFQKVYVTEKNTNKWTPLTLLFILEENVAMDNKQEFINLLEQDERINHVSPCRDLPFETVDTRYIEKEKDTIAVGEVLSLTIKGSIDYYVQPFDFSVIAVKPMTDKNYTVEDFSEIKLKSVKQGDNGWLYLELSEENYFSIIKASDVLSRLSNIETVAFTSGDPYEIPHIWQVSDQTIVSIETNPSNYGTAIIRGLKPGEVTVDLAGVKCTITVK